MGHKVPYYNWCNHSLGVIMHNKNLPFISFLTLILISITTASEWRGSNSLKTQNNRFKDVLVREKENSENLIALEYSFPNAHFLSTNSKVRGKAAEKVIVGNCQQISIPGKPVMPIVPARVIIPSGKKIDKIFLSDFKSSEKMGSHVIAYGQTPIPLKSDAMIIETEADSRIYDSNTPFPLNNFELISVQKKCGVSIAIINLYPITYYSQSEDLVQHYNFTVNIALKNDTKRERELAVKPQRVDPKTLGVENPEALDTYEELPATITNSNSIINSRESAKYLIIATDKIIAGTKNPSLNDLLEYRKSEGFTGKIVSYESILNGPGSEETTLKMRNFIRDAYNNWGTEYIFMAGSYRQCDSYIKNKDLHYMVSADATSGGGYQRTDVYYECLDGSYNYDTISTPDSKKRFGEWTDGEDGGIPDFFAEVNIGRLMALTPEDVSNAIYKILEYEKSRDPFKSEVFLVGEAIFPASKCPNDMMWYAKPSMMAIWNGGNDAGNITKGLKDIPGINLTTMFDADTCNNAKTPNHPEIRTVGWEADQMIEKLNSNKFGMINHLGHGNEEHGLDIDVIKHTERLENTNYPFLYTQACLNAGFMYKQDTKRSFSRYLTAESRDYGICGGVFNMNLGYSPFSDDIEIYGPSERMNLQFWDAYAAEDMRRAGRLHTDSHEDNVNFINEHHIKYCIYITTLLADPAMKIDMENSAVSIPDSKSFKSGAKLKKFTIANINRSAITMHIPKDDTYNFKLFNSKGRVVYKTTKKLSAGKQIVPLNLRSNSKGLYIIKITGNNSSIKRKVLFTK